MRKTVNTADEDIGPLDALAVNCKHSRTAGICETVKKHVRKDASNDWVECGIEILVGEPPGRRHHVQELIAPFEIVELDALIAAAAEKNPAHDEDETI
jgi:hypothetical protein